MTLAYRSWVPAGTVAPPSLRAAVAGAVDAWSRDWFASDAMQVLGGFARVEPKAELRGASRHVHDLGMALILPSTGLAGLGAMALAVNAAATRPPADATLLTQVGTECLAALKHRLLQAFGDGPDNWRETELGQPAGAVHRLTISTVERAFTLTLEVTADLFARAVLRALGEVPKAPPLCGAAAALASLHVTLAARLGGCAVTLAELEGLAAGDVLVLDHALDAPLRLAIDGASAPRGACTLSLSETQVTLEITESLAA